MYASTWICTKITEVYPSEPKKGLDISPFASPKMSSISRSSRGSVESLEI